MYKGLYMGLDLAAILQGFLTYRFCAYVILCVYCIYIYIQGFYRYTGRGTFAPLGLGSGFFLHSTFCYATHKTFMKSIWADDSVYAQFS